MLLFLQETHTDTDNEVEWGMRWTGNLIMSHGTRNRPGVAVLFSEHINNILEVKETVKGRLLLMQIE